MEKYSHRDRLEMIMAGERPDRFAASFWRHFFHMEHHAEGTAEATVYFQKTFDWDFVKINPRADYHVEDWGFRQEWSHNEFAKHRKTHFPVTSVEDWDNIARLEPTAAVLAEHLRVISLVRKGCGKEVPILMTLFSPLAVAGRMVPDRQLLVDHLRQYPDRMENVLEIITDTYVRYAAEIRNAGADGLFFATTQWASGDMLTWEEYQRFGVPYDLRVIAGAESDALNLLHVCGSNNFLPQLAEIDYNCRLYNYDSNDETNLSLEQAGRLLSGRTLVGGIDGEDWLLKGTPDDVHRRIKAFKAAHDAGRLIIGPGCAVPPEVPLDNLRAVRETL